MSEINGELPTPLKEQPAKEPKHFPFSPPSEIPSLSRPDQRIKNFLQESKEIGKLRAFLFADQKASLSSSPKQEAVLRENVSQLVEKDLSKEKLEQMFDLFREREEDLFQKTALVSQKKSALPNIAEGSLAGATGLGVVAHGLKEAFSRVAWPIGAFLGIKGAGEILKGQSNPLTQTALRLTEEVKNLFAVTKFLQSAEGCQSFDQLLPLLQSSEELAKDPQKVKMLAETLRSLKRATLVLNLTDPKLGFWANIPQKNEGQARWQKAHFELKHILATISFFERKLFTASKGNDKLQKELLLISLGLPENIDNPQRAQTAVSDWEKDLFLEATNTRLKLAGGYAAAVPLLTAPLLNSLSTIIGKVHSLLLPTGVSPKPIAIGEPVPKFAKLPVIFKGGSFPIPIKEQSEWSRFWSRVWENIKLW